MVGLSDCEKTYIVYKSLEGGTPQPMFAKIYFFDQHPQPLYDIIENEYELPEFVQGVNFELIFQLFEKQRDQISAHLVWLMCRKLKLPGVCEHC